MKSAWRERTSFPILRTGPSGDASILNRRKPLLAMWGIVFFLPVVSFLGFPFLSVALSIKSPLCFVSFHRNLLFLHSCMQSFSCWWNTGFHRNIFMYFLWSRVLGFAFVWIWTPFFFARGEECGIEILSFLLLISLLIFLFLQDLNIYAFSFC